MNQIVLQIARSFGGQPHFLLVPLLVGTRAGIPCWPMRSPASHRTLKRLDVACVGVGALPRSWEVLYLGRERALLPEDGAVGAFSSLLRHPRETVENPLNDRLIGISLEQLRKVPTVVAVAGGVEKTKALVGAVSGPSLITDLFIDEELGRSILNELGTQEVKNGAKG
jgi:DNA-binding transcriptional regulator LsrR (DeoR family)